MDDIKIVKLVGTSRPTAQLIDEVYQDVLSVVYESGLPAASVLGILTMVTHDVIQEAKKE